MKIFFGIMAVVLLLLLWDEKDKNKSKDLKGCFISTIVGMIAVTVLKLIF